MIYAELSEKYLAIISKLMKQPKNKESINLDAGESGILYYLIYHNGATPSELQKHLNVGSGRIANALNTLQNKGLIFRQDALDDRHKVKVFITEEGKLLQENRRREYMEYIQRVLEKMGEEEASEFLRLLEKFMNYNQILIASERKEG